MSNETMLGLIIAGVVIGSIIGYIAALKSQRKAVKTYYKAEIDKAVKQRKPHIVTRKIEPEELKTWIDEDKNK